MQLFSRSKTWGRLSGFQALPMRLWGWGSPSSVPMIRSPISRFPLFTDLLYAHPSFLERPTSLKQRKKQEMELKCIFPKRKGGDKAFQFLLCLTETKVLYSPHPLCGVHPVKLEQHTLIKAKGEKNQAPSQRRLWLGNQGWCSGVSAVRGL